MESAPSVAPGTPLDEQLLKTAKRQFGWEDLLILPTLLLLFVLVEPTSNAFLPIVALLAFSTAHQRIVKRLDAMAKLVERINLRLANPDWRLPKHD